MQLLKVLHSTSLPCIQFALIMAVPAIAIAHLWGGAPALATNQSQTDTIDAQNQPTLMANMFGDIFRRVEEALDTINTVDSLVDRLTGGQNQPAQQPVQESSPAADTVPIAGPSISAPSASAGSDLQILHQDENPAHCQMVSSDGEGTPCRAFQLSQVGELLIFTYYFSAAPMSFIAPSEPFSQSTTTAVYPTGEIRVANEPIEDFGNCAVAHMQGGSDWGQYHMVNCNADMGLELSYRRQ